MFKDSGANQWETAPLGSVATLQRGYDLPNAVRKEGKIPIISSGGVTGRHSVSKHNGPGVITGRYGSIGDLYWIDEPYWPLNTSLFVNDFHGNDKRFVFYLLQSVDFKKLSDKTGVPGVNRNDVHKIKVKVPPLPEQRKIAEILRTWDEAIEKLEALRAAKERRASAIRLRLFEAEYASHKCLVRAQTFRYWQLCRMSASSAVMNWTAALQCRTVIHLLTRSSVLGTS